MSRLCLQSYLPPFMLLVCTCTITEWFDSVTGEWQTEDYHLSNQNEIIDGRVPRNAYGNVEVFTDAMLPPGSYSCSCLVLAKMTINMPFSAFRKLLQLGLRCYAMYPWIAVAAMHVML